jgi:hypothetical protein
LTPERAFFLHGGGVAGKYIFVVVFARIKAFTTPNPEEKVARGFTQRRKGAKEARKGRKEKKNPGLRLTSRAVCLRLN